MEDQNHHLVRIFKDASSHKEVAGIVARHLTSRTDIRDVALEGIDLTGVRKVLDLGCGFGFFTEGLKDRKLKVTHITGIDCHPEYEWFYFHSCEKVNTHLKKRFISKGSDAIKDIEAGAFDMVLCSYALYFFPEIIQEVSRVLKKEGIFVVVTHAMPHLHQFSDFVRALLHDKGIELNDKNPYERLIGKFSDRNGERLLREGFHHICTKNYRSQMVFEEDAFEDFAAYFNFKRHFFIPTDVDPDDRYHEMVLNSVKDFFEAGNRMVITKDDVIFICTDPVKGGKP